MKSSKLGAVTPKINWVSAIKRAYKKKKEHEKDSDCTKREKCTYLERKDSVEN